MTHKNKAAMKNPFRDLSTHELELAYISFSASDDREAVALVGDVYNEKTFIDVTQYGIGSSDRP